MILLIPPFHGLKDAKIEPLIIEKVKLQELKTLLANPKVPDLRKSFVMRNTSGSCSICGNLPSHRAIYRKYGVIIIEKYCDNCLARMQT